MFSFTPNLQAQGTAFTYQGWLNSGGSTDTGVYDFRFKLYSDALGNTQVGSSYSTNAAGLSNGLFTTSFDFGTGIFLGANRWLEVDVKTNGGASYTVLTPLQAVTPTPYAVFAGSASNLSGTIAATQLPASVVTNGASISGTFSGNGVNVMNVSAATLRGLSKANFWQLGGRRAGSWQHEQPIAGSCCGRIADAATGSGLCGGGRLSERHWRFVCQLYRPSHFWSNHCRWWCGQPPRFLHRWLYDRLCGLQFCGEEFWNRRWRSGKFNDRRERHGGRRAM